MFRRLFRRADKSTDSKSPGEEPQAWAGATRDDWTVPGTYFKAAGWRLQTGTSSQMSWEGAFGGTMTFSRDDAPAWTSDELDLDRVRQQHRATAVARRGGLVSAEFVEMANGAPALEIVTKYRQGAGYLFEGRLHIDESPSAYTIAVVSAERKTGVRESMVNGLRMQLGEIDIFAMMAGPANPATGGRKVPGMQLDPYDAAHDDEATYSASDDPRIDNVMQAHPLAVVRSSLRWARATWECDAPSKVRRRELPRASPPKVVLSDHFFETLHAMLKKG